MQTGDRGVGVGARFSSKTEMQTQVLKCSSGPPSPFDSPEKLTSIHVAQKISALVTAAWTLISFKMLFPPPEGLPPGMGRAGYLEVSDY